MPSRNLYKSFYFCIFFRSTCSVVVTYLLVCSPFFYTDVVATVLLICWSNNYFCFWSFCLYAYKIGHCKPLVRIIDLVSHTIYIVCINFIYKWRDLQYKVDSELFMPVLITLKVFARNLLGAIAEENFFLYFVLLSGLGLYVEHLSNKPHTTSNRERHVWECTYTSGRNRVIKKAKTRTFYFKNVRGGLQNCRTKQTTVRSNSISLMSIQVACFKLWRSNE